MFILSRFCYPSLMTLTDFELSSLLSLLISSVILFSFFSGCDIASIDRHLLFDLLERRILFSIFDKLFVFQTNSQD